MRLGFVHSQGITEQHRLQDTRPFTQDTAPCLNRCSEEVLLLVRLDHAVRLHLGGARKNPPSRFLIR